MRWAGRITYVSDKKQKIFVIKSDGKWSIGRRKDNIKTDLNEKRIEDQDWVQRAQDWVQWCATANMLMKL
jgi:hypothetical protein